VLSIDLDHAHASDEDDSPFSQYIDVLVSTPDGWTSTGGVPGSDWPVPYGARPPGEAPCFTGFAAGCQPPGEKPVWLRSGIAPVGATAVRVVFPAGEQVVTVEPVSGAFLVSAPDPSTPAELVGLSETE
jgi:hypothetical protein